MNYTVADLIDLLANLDPDMEVRVAHQPSYPLSAELLGVTTTTSREGEELVYLVAGPAYEYAPEAIYEEVGEDF